MHTTRKTSLLVIMAKAPVPGTVKTRLFPDLPPTAATDLYRCFLQDRIEEMASLRGIDLAIAYTPADAEAYFTAFTVYGFDLFPQQGGDLGERLHAIFVRKSAEGYGAIVILDSDSPDLPRSIVEESFASLASGQSEAVFGPCYDGGYYLVGLREPHPELFHAIPWSTSRVLQRTLDAAAKNAVGTKLLPPWNDLDTFEDLITYYHRHRDAPPAHAGAGGRTFQYLARLEGVARGIPPRPPPPPVRKAE